MNQSDFVQMIIFRTEEALIHYNFLQISEKIKRTKKCPSVVHESETLKLTKKNLRL